MIAGVNIIFIAPWFVLLAIAVAVGWRRRSRPGAGSGFKAGLIALVVGVGVLTILFAVMIAIYYASGGH